MALLLAAAASAFSHQQKTAITTVLFNERSGYIEVMHKFFLHDAEHAVKDLFNRDADIIAKQQTRQQFAQYVQQNFGLSDGETPLKLEYVGVEIEGKYLWIYQQVPVKAIKQLNISHGALQELWPSQVNLVNIEGKGKIQSLLFESDSDWQGVDLDHKH
nr:DUF6702 family protein [Paraferrimonas sp. SM1919]